MNARQAHLQGRVPQMTHSEFLIGKADAQLQSQGRIDIDLHYQMLAAGLDTETIERKFNDSKED